VIKRCRIKIINVCLYHTEFIVLRQVCRIKGFQKYFSMDIKEIKAKLSITSVLEHYGIKVNRNKQVCCPFHDDKTPSMQVYEDKGLVYCHSSNCKNGGKHLDQIEVIQQKENLSKHEAILKAVSLITGRTTTTTTKPTTMQEETLNDIFKKFTASLHTNKKAIAYLESRNLYDEKIEAGYNDGVKYKSLKNCIVFPLKDSSGNITSFYGRSIINNDTSRHYYSKDRKGLYPSYPAAGTKQLILTESIIDTLTINHYLPAEALAQAGTNFYSLALYGTNGFTQEHEQAIRELKDLQEIILFFDGDEAGRKAVEKYAAQLKTMKADITISSVNTPEGEDPNSLVQSHEKEILIHLIESRTTIFSSPAYTKVPADRPEGSNEKKSLPTLNTKNPDYLTFAFETLHLHIIGGIALYPLDKLKITLKIERKDSMNPLHSIRQSNLDLYSDEQLQKFIRSASERLEVGSKEMHLAIASLISELEHYRQERIEQQKPKIEPIKTLSGARKQELLKILKDKNLLATLNTLIGQTGVVGEEDNRMIMFSVFTSRLTNNPLHIICLGASGTGKTYLQEKIAELIPKPHKVSFTASTENALYYVGKTDLKHKVIIIEDLDGANAALYVLRELQTKAYVNKLVPVKDSKGNMKTIQLEVEGPICLSGTTTKEKLYEDNANRCLLIYLDNSEAQQQAIMQYQRKLHAGKIDKAQEENAKELLQDMQLMFRNIMVVNPYAEKLTIPETVFKPLRTNAHYLQFIEAITFIYQFQCEVKKDAQGMPYIEATLEHIEIANRLLKDVLLSKSDELTKACRDFLEMVKGLLTKEKKTSFYRSNIREWTRINPDNVRHYLAQLVKFGYVKIIGGNKHKGGFEYEITDKDEYTKLNNSVQSALDKALEEIKKQHGKG
jgi:DNA primase